MSAKKPDLNAKLHETLSKQGIRHYSEPIYRVSESRFYKALGKAKKQNSHGWMVDKDEKKKYSGMKMYLSRDGKAGMAIDKSGNVHSLFSAPRSHGGKGNALGSLIPFAVAHGGKKLDCYGAGLQDMYARYGAKATGKVKFNGEYSDDWQALPDGHPDKKSPPDYVVAMILPKKLDDVIKSYDSTATVDLKKVKTYRSYDRMLEARDRELNGQTALMPNVT